MSESATSATQNNMTTCLETFEKDRFSSFPHRLPPSLKFVNIIKQVGMSESATPATQNGRTTCVETFEKESFCGFPHRHGDATGKGETRDRARGCRKNSISYETSSNFHSWQHNKKTSFAASPIDTARPRENQRRETRQVGAPKRAFRARNPPIFTLCSFKIDVFLRVFLRT